MRGSRRRPARPAVAPARAFFKMAPGHPSLRSSGETVMHRLAAALLLAALVAACGEGAPGPQGEKGEGGDAAIRIVQQEGCTASCSAKCAVGETMLFAYCYFAQPSNSVSASNVVYQAAADPKAPMTATCLSGGRNI